MSNVIKLVSGWRSVLVVFVVFSLLSVMALPSEADGVSIGDHFAGGIVFYVDQSGAHGLVAAEMDLPGDYTWDRAHAACQEYEVNGYSGWYMPSRWELNKLYEHKDVVGGFGASDYWSSSECGAVGAWNLDFSSGSQNLNYQATNGNRVRPVRAF